MKSSERQWWLLAIVNVLRQEGPFLTLGEICQLLARARDDDWNGDVPESVHELHRQVEEEVTPHLLAGRLMIGLPPALNEPLDEFKDNIHVVLKTAPANVLIEDGLGWRLVEQPNDAKSNNR